MCLIVSKLFCDSWADVSCSKTQLNKCSVASVPNSFRTAATYSGLETSFLSWRNSGCTRGTPMDMVDIKSSTNKLEMEKCEDSIWKGGVTKFFPQSCQNGFLLAPFGWEHLTFRAKFPKKWKPKLQLVDQRCAAHCSHSVVALADFPEPPGWEGSPAPQGSSCSAEPASATPPPITSHLVLNPLAPAFPRNSGGAAPWGMPVCPRGCSWCQSWNSQILLWQWCCRLRFVLPTTAQGQARRKRSQEGKTGSLFIQKPWQWIGCNYSLKYSLVLIIQVAGNRRNTGETQPRWKETQALN